MSDITQRLRTLSATEIVDASDGERSIRVRTNDELRAVGSEAADEIERLRSLLVDANGAFDECTGEYSAGLVHGEAWRDFRPAGSEAPR